MLNTVLVNRIMMSRKAEEADNRKNFSILLVEEDFEISDQLERILKNNKRFDCDVTTVAKGKNALDYLEDHEYDLIMSDYEMEDMDGIEFLKEVKNGYPSDAIRLLIMEEHDTFVAEKALRDGHIDGYIENPWNSQEVKLIVFGKLVRKSDLQRKNRVNVDKVTEALEMVKKFQTKITAGSSTDKETLIFEFDSSSEFNKFSFELKRMKNVQILDVHIFQDKYVINVGLYPESYEKIR